MMERSAVLSPCGAYRYVLERWWDRSLPVLPFCLLNPSKADHQIDDQTVRVGVGRARLLGFGGLAYYNAFAFRAQSPDDMKRASDPVGPENDKVLRALAASRPRAIVAGWGDDGLHLNRATAVRTIFAGVPLYCLLLTKRGEPRHPLRIAYAESLKPLNEIAALLA